MEPPAVEQKKAREDYSKAAPAKPQARLHKRKQVIGIRDHLDVPINPSRQAASIVLVSDYPKVASNMAIRAEANPADTAAHKRAAVHMVAVADDPAAVVVASTAVANPVAARDNPRELLIERPKVAVVTGLLLKVAVIPAGAAGELDSGGGGYAAG